MIELDFTQLTRTEAALNATVVHSPADCHSPVLPPRATGSVLQDLPGPQQIFDARRWRDRPTIASSARQSAFAARLTVLHVSNETSKPDSNSQMISTPVAAWLSISFAHQQESHENGPVPSCETIANDPDGDGFGWVYHITCLLYTSPSPRDQRGSRMPSSA